MMDAVRALSLAVVVAFSQAVQSAEPAKPGAAPQMTKAELRACMDEQDALQLRRAEIARGMQEHELAAKAFGEASAQLETAQKETDVKDPTKVAAFNERIVEHNRKAQEHNAQGAALNARAQQLQTDSAAYTNRCADRTFAVPDREAILKERARAASSAKP